MGGCFSRGIMKDKYRDVLQESLKGHDSRYVEIRVEQTVSSSIRYRGKDLEEAGSSSGIGGCVRALSDGGWGFACFSSLEGIKEKAKLAVRNSKLVKGNRIDLAPIDPVVDYVPATTVKNPSSVSLPDKKKLLDEYIDLIWETPGITSSSIRYGDSNRKITFASSEGSYIEQDRINVVFGASAMARDGGDVQQSTISLGSLGDFAFVEGLHSQVKQMSKRAVELLKATPVKGGPYTVILDPVLAGVFIHEAFGHLSEADHVYENDRLKDIMVLGKEFGSRNLNVVDGAAVPGLRGSYKYDEEGVPSNRTDLIKDGILVGRLHSRETAAKMSERPTGNARAISSLYPPIVRMTNTYIEPTEHDVADLFSDVKEGIYAKNWYGGMTSMEQYTFSAGEAFMIRNGKIAELLRPVMLTGNLFVTLKNLDGIANDLEMNQGGGCGKGGQMPLPVSNGSPHIRINRCLINGS